MFGYIVPSLGSLNEEERFRYLEVYCGVCRCLAAHYGQLERLAVSYDLAFLVLVLGSLYEPQEYKERKRCVLHPGKSSCSAISEFSHYAADLSVLLAYHKLIDNWLDEHSYKAKAASTLLRHAYCKACRSHPQKATCIEQAMDDIHMLEQAANKQTEGNLHIPLDAPANRFGAMLGDLFACRDDFWADDLRRFGARLGKFVYVMDAAVDIEEDKKNSAYNPFLGREASRETIRQDLKVLAAGAVEVFERLPLERDAHIMRSVLYAGMWQRFELKEGTGRHA